MQRSRTPACVRPQKFAAGGTGTPAVRLDIGLLWAGPAGDVVKPVCGKTAMLDRRGRASGGPVENTYDAQSQSHRPCSPPRLAPSAPATRTHRQDARQRRDRDGPCRRMRRSQRGQSRVFPSRQRAAAAPTERPADRVEMCNLQVSNTICVVSGVLL